MEKRPGAILVCNAATKQGSCDRHLERFDETMSYWNFGMMLSYYPHLAATLADCEVKDYFGPE